MPVSTSMPIITPCSHENVRLKDVRLKVDSRRADYFTFSEQPACSQPQAISVVSFAASQYGLQYLLLSPAGQLQLLWAHLFFSLFIWSPMTLRSHHPVTRGKLG
jgi:hypothetical protein